MNLVLITIDCLRADHLSCLGYPKKTTPNLDYLAGKGLLFDQVISNSPFTPASFISIFTSTYPLMYEGEMRVGSRRTTLAEVLKKHGYETAAFHPNIWLSRYYGFNRGFSTFDDKVHDNRQATLLGKIERTSANIKNKGRLYRALAQAYRSIRFSNPYTEADSLNKKVISWLKDGPENFFLWIHYMDVHNPYLPCRKISSPLEKYRLYKLNQKAFGGRGGLTAGDTKRLVDLYDDKIRFTDEMIGDLLGRLESPDDTFIIVTADHGQQFMEHGNCGHTSYLYDEVLRVPLIITGPGLKKQEISRQFSLIDLAPTILDILKIKKTESFLGSSMLGSANKGREEAISETPQDKRSLRRVQAKSRLDTNHKKISLRTTGWKYIYTEGKRDELYNLKNDPKEKLNLIKTEPKTAADLLAKMTSHIDFERKTAPGEAASIKDKIKRLKISGRI